MFNPFLAMMPCMKLMEVLVSLRSGSNAVWVLLQQFALLAAAFNMQAAELTDQDIIFCQNCIQDRLVPAVKIRRFSKTLERGALIEVMNGI